MEKTGEENIEKMRETYLQDAIKTEREKRILAAKKRERKIKDDIKKEWERRKKEGREKRQ